MKASARMYTMRWVAFSCLFSLVPLIVVLSIGGCNTQPAPPLPSATLPVFRTGAEVLHHSAFESMKGMTIGLVVNHTARIDSAHLGDVVQHAPNITLGAFFGPEHGVRGDADAGEEIVDDVDKKTGVPVYSLYGKQRKPSQASLEGLDALVFDIQDIGARFYTYISTLGYAMQAAAEAGIPFYVFDRPNPLGGEYVSGFIRQEAFEGFVGLYPIPIAHGLTVGELALMIKGEAFLEGLEDLDLRVIKMEGWERSIKWPALSRQWRPTSPNIPDFETALIYVGTCLFEAVAASEGRGTQAPFKQLGASWVDSEILVDTLNSFALAGVSFSGTSFIPQSIEGMSSNPRYKGEEQHGVMLEVTDVTQFDPVATGIHLVYAFYQQVPIEKKEGFFNERWMGLLAGTDALKQQLEARIGPADIVASWQQEVEQFKELRSKYLLYH